MADPHPTYAIDYRRPAGESSLVPPDSPQWRVFRNPVALAVGGVAAVLLEFAEPRIRSGVWAHSTFKTDPIGRARRTGAAALIGVYGPQSAARKMIAGVNRLHVAVKGETPAGEAYSALDPELLDWVAATAGWGFLTAYDRFVAPVSPQARDRYYRDGEPVARLYGVRNPLRFEDDFTAMLDRMAPRFEPHPIGHEFLRLITSGQAAPAVPAALHRALGHGAVSILPPAVRATLQIGPEHDLTPAERRILRFAGRLADLLRDPTSPAWRAARRLGLPGDFAWRAPAAQARALAARGRPASSRKAPPRA